LKKLCEKIAEIICKRDGACVHGGDKTGHWSVGDVLMRAV
jgi:hypothetical protein